MARRPPVLTVESAGAEKVARDFARVGQAGAQMARTVVDGARAIPPALRAADAAAAELGDGLESLAERGGTVSRVLTTFGRGGLLAGAVVGGMAIMGQAAASAAGDLLALESAASRAGVSAETLQEIQFGLRAVGASADSAGPALAALQLRLAEIRAGGGDEQAGLLAGIGIGRDEIAGMTDTEQALRRIAGAMQALDASARANLADKLGIADLGPLLAEGEAGLMRFRAAARDAGAVFEDDVVARGADAARAFDELALTIEVRLKSALVPIAELLVSMMGAAEGVADALLRAGGAYLGPSKQIATLRAGQERLRALYGDEVMTGGRSTREPDFAALYRDRQAGRLTEAEFRAALQGGGETAAQRAQRRMPLGELWGDIGYYSPARAERPSLRRARDRYQGLQEGIEQEEAIVQREAEAAAARATARAAARLAGGGGALSSASLDAWNAWRNRHNPQGAQGGNAAPAAPAAPLRDPLREALERRIEGLREEHGWSSRLEDLRLRSKLSTDEELAAQARLADTLADITEARRLGVIATDAEAEALGRRAAAAAEEARPGRLNDFLGDLRAEHELRRRIDAERARSPHLTEEEARARLDLAGALDDLAMARKRGLIASDEEARGLERLLRLRYGEAEAARLSAEAEAAVRAAKAEGIARDEERRARFAAFPAELARGLEGQFVADNVDWQDIEESLGRGWRQTLWDAFLGEPMEWFALTLRNAFADAFAGLGAGLGGGGSVWTALLGGLLTGDFSGSGSAPTKLPSKLGKKALGGLASGLTLVGEDGPELVDFLTPARVHPAARTRMALAGAGAGGGPLAVYAPVIHAPGASLEALESLRAELRRTQAEFGVWAAGEGARARAAVADGRERRLRR